jgi:hypothetical protein
MKNVMMMNDEDIKNMQDQVKGENAVEDDEPEQDNNKQGNY